ncbi:hypothetical protein CANARDRAFT_28400 [[Candida] arabinofermentans NRRL YB-2248]|uniref:Cdc23 domain-containing protein n=1 Tax=[Candida] arabinofermentans NRRL YB-2248 TaxID=983967 RepID=A0A1E4T1P8_9ASCO|nr:hypothetical protein CANARDRAFT_28400 [[Candida] arabinofermentans NRRL YB-2248]
MDFEQQVELRLALAESAKVLQELNLYHGSKWSSEALNGLVKPSNEKTVVIFQQLKRRQNTSFLAELTPQEEFLEFLEQDKVLVANSYFNFKELDRCSYVLKDCVSSKALFIKLYAMYLSGEKKKDDAAGGVLGQQGGKAQNLKLTQILKELENYKASIGNKVEDPFLLYLYGLVAIKMNDNTLAQELFYRSLTIYPFNWACWSELIASLTSFSEGSSILHKFTKNSKFVENPLYGVMLKFFKVTINQEFFQQFSELYDDLNYLLEIFPHFSFLKIQKALISYNALDYSTAESIFDDVLVSDPLRLDDMDTYSNILYVMEKKPKLAFLAQFAAQIDNFRPETCCIVANYYSLKFDHQKAIMYYKRALALNKNCLSAWTLMGHEFVELKNSHAAIESYRMAVDTNNKDFRAWYGLGQAYEVLDMHLYSLYYYQRACALKPLDKRMWQAVGNCCEKLGEYEDSIKAYKKGLSVSAEMDPVILFKLAKLYQAIKDTSNAAVFMKLCLDEEINEGVTNETAKARLWLAKHSMESHSWQQAYTYASEMTHGTSHEIEEARGIAREARAKINGRMNESIL